MKLLFSKSPEGLSGNVECGFVNAAENFLFEFRKK